MTAGAEMLIGALSLLAPVALVSSTSLYDGLATIFALVAGIGAVAGFVYALQVWRKSPSVAVVCPNNEERKKALDLRIELSTKLFDLGLLLLALLWGFLLAKRDEAIKLSNWQDIVLFVASNFLLLLSLGSHVAYRIKLANLFWLLGDLGGPDAKLPDLTNDLVEGSFRIQWWLFFASLAAGLLTIVVLKLLRT